MTPPSLQACVHCVSAARNSDLRLCAGCRGDMGEDESVVGSQPSADQASSTLYTSPHSRLEGAANSWRQGHPGNPTKSHAYVNEVSHSKRTLYLSNQHSSAISKVEHRISYNYMQSLTASNWFTALSSQAESEQEAREVCESRVTASRAEQDLVKLGHTPLGEGQEERDVVPLVVRGDVAGSVEVLVELLQSRQPEQLDLSVVQTGVGGVTESDVETAASAGGKVALARNLVPEIYSSLTYFRLSPWIQCCHQ